MSNELLQLKQVVSPLYENNDPISWIRTDISDACSEGGYKDNVCDAAGALAALGSAMITALESTQVVDGPVYFCRICSTAGKSERHASNCSYASLTKLIRDNFGGK